MGFGQHHLTAVAVDSQSGLHCHRPAVCRDADLQVLFVACHDTPAVQGSIVQPMLGISIFLGGPPILCMGKKPLKEIYSLPLHHFFRSQLLPPESILHFPITELTPMIIQGSSASRSVAGTSISARKQST